MEFNRHGNAPETVERKQMIGLALASDEDTMNDVLAEGAQGVGPAVLSSPCLMDAMRLLDPDSVPRTTRLNNLLVKAGWTQLAAKVKWQGRAHRCWVKGSELADGTSVRNLDGAELSAAVRAALDATIRVPDADVKTAEELFG